MQFRQKAIAKLQSPEELDTPLRLARPQGWLVLGALCLVVVLGAAWAVVGTLPSSLDAPGILTHNEGSFTLQSPYAGQVTSILVEQGSTFPAGTPIASVQTHAGVRVIRAVAGGRVITMLTNVGQIVGVGSSLATVERVGVDDPLVAVLYLAGVSPPSVPVGAPVDLVVQGVPDQTYGILRGRVDEVSQFPETQPEIATFLGDPQLGRAFTAAGEPLKVVVTLEPDVANASGYRWSTAQGPPFPVDSRMLVSAAIHLTPIHPVSWLMSS